MGGCELLPIQRVCDIYSVDWPVSRSIAPPPPLAFYSLSFSLSSPQKEEKDKKKKDKTFSTFVGNSLFEKPMTPTPPGRMTRAISVKTSKGFVR